jgi:PKD repeat protein
LNTFVPPTAEGDFPPEIFIIIPDIIGLPLEEVRQIFAEAGLEIGQIEEIEMEAQAGTVIDTDPVIGSEVEPGTVVNVVITTPPVVPPLADFTIVENSGFEYSFVNQSTNAETYLWDFGDGTTSEEMNPTHTYDVTSEGSNSFNVILTVSGPGGKDGIMKVISFIYIR